MEERKSREDKLVTGRSLAFMILVMNILENILANILPNILALVLAIIFAIILPNIVTNFFAYDQVTNYLESMIFFLKKLLWDPRKVKFRHLWLRWS